MTYQIRPLFYQIQRVLKQANINYDPLLPTHIRTVTVVNRLHTGNDAFIGIAILPGRINVLVRPKTFIAETTKIVQGNFITTYSAVVMDAAGELRLVEGLTIDHTDTDGFDHFVNQVADLVDEQAGRNHPNHSPNIETMNALHHVARQIAKDPPPTWAGWVAYLLEQLQDHHDREDHANMLTELSLAIAVRQLEGKW